MGRAGWILALVLLMSLFPGCDEPQLDGPARGPSVISPGPGNPEGTGTRPQIPRSNPPADTPDDAQYQNPGEQPSGRQPMPMRNTTPGVDLDVPFGDTIGKHHPRLTAAEYPLLKHSPVRVTGNLLVGYDERIIFDFGPNSTGRVVFSIDEDTEEVGSFLRFEHPKPIFEYSVTLDRGTFEELQGRDIRVLGHTYTIAEANNRSVTLYGVDVPSNLFFDDGEELIVNSTRQSATVVKVTPRRIAFELFARGDDENRDILLSPGESIADNMGQNALGSQLFDIRYTGAPIQGSEGLKLTRTDHGYKLTADLATGEHIFTLVEQDAGRLVLGRSESPLHITPCNGHCIAPGESAVLTSPAGRSYVIKYVSTGPRYVNIKAKDDNEYHFQYLGTPGRDARAEIRFGNDVFRVSVGAKDNETGKHNISIEQGFRDGRAEIVLANGTILRVGEITGTTLPLELIVPRAKERETTRLTLVFDPEEPEDEEWRIEAGNLTFIEDEGTDDFVAVTGYGATIVLDKDGRDLPDNEGDEARILVPRTQAYGIVKIEG